MSQPSNNLGLAPTDTIAVAVAGRRNLTRVTRTFPGAPTSIEFLAQAVARRRPGKTYYLVVVDKATQGRRKKVIVARWHVGAGFVHKDGWWVEVEELKWKS